MDTPKTWYNYGLSKEPKCHFVQEIIDEGNTLIIYKHYLKSKQKWKYEVESRYILEFFHWNVN